MTDYQLEDVVAIRRCDNKSEFRGTCTGIIKVKPQNLKAPLNAMKYCGHCDTCHRWWDIDSLEHYERVF
jgi:hypothetical protein